MKKIIFVLVMAVNMFAVGCTENARVKRGGGNKIVNLAPNEKFVNITWKDDDLWILTRSGKSEEAKEKYTFQEDSSYGFANGTVTIVEK